MEKRHDTKEKTDFVNTLEKLNLEYCNAGISLHVNVAKKWKHKHCDNNIFINCIPSLEYLCREFLYNSQSSTHTFSLGGGVYVISRL